jgi:hypothetical protein
MNMLKKIFYLVAIIISSTNCINAQFGKIHYIIESNKNGDTLACYAYNKKGLIKNIKFYRNHNHTQNTHYNTLKTHLSSEYIYNDSNDFSLLTKDIWYGFIEKHSFCTCSDPFCDGIEGCNQIEIELNIPYIENVKEYFYTKDLKFKYSIVNYYDTGNYIFSRCYNDSCLKFYKKRNEIFYQQEIYLLSQKDYNSEMFSIDELFSLNIINNCNCIEKTNLFDTLKSEEFNFYKDSNNMYYAFSKKYGKILLNEKMPCSNNPKKYYRLTFYKYKSNITNNGSIPEQYPQKEIIKRIKSTKDSRLKIKRY